MTAGHCYNVNNRIYSGNHFFGILTRKHSIPTWDMAMITGSTHGHHIYSDPGIYNIGEVRGSADPAWHSTVCVSGMVTLQVCGVTVESTYATLCDYDGCTSDLFVAQKPGVTVGQAGDSGAPVYNGTGTGNGIAIRGMEIGGTNRTNFFAHKESTIRYKMGGDVAIHNP